jgi:hypothetical protein
MMVTTTKESAMTHRKTFAWVKYFFILAGFVSVAPLARAQTSTLDIRPLLRIEEEFTTNPPVLLHQKSSFVSRGGYVFLQLSIMSADGKLSGGAGRGFANVTDREVIRDILTRGQIGRRKDCVRISSELLGYRQFTWYGRNGRRNTFRYVSAPDLSSGLPECSEQANDLLEGMQAVVGVIVVDGGEFFVTPSGS